MFAISVDRRAPVPVFEQICAGIRARIRAGDLRDGDRLPPTRAFATELGVSRSTVVTAYDQLVAEGYLDSLQGSGHTVRASGDMQLAGPDQPPEAPDAPDAPEPPPPRPPFPDQPPGQPPRAFQAGNPDMRLFPHRQWARTVARICRTDPQALLAGCGQTGNPDLRRAIARHVADWRGIRAAPHQIIVTAGASDALDLCLRALTRFGDRIGLEDPGYPPLAHFAAAHGLQPVPLPIDASGACLPGPAPAPGLVVLTPSQQYPLGGAMTPGRRLEFIRWAQQTDGWIIEDDYDSEFRYAGRPIPAMAGFDRLNRTIYVGSFSKIFSNALRIGYAVVPEALLDRLHRVLDRGGVRAGSMPQQALAEFIGSGEFYRHLRRVRRIYDERRKFLLGRLARDFSRFGQFTDHQAGMQLVFHLVEAHRDHAVAAQAARLGVAVEPLSAYGTGAAPLNGLILGFCAASEDEMAAALPRLARAFNPY